MNKASKKELALECEDWFSLTLTEVSYSFGVSKDMILEIVNEGIVNTEKNEEEEFIFDANALHHIGVTLRLKKDLGINLAGAALAIQLLQEIEHLDMMLHQKMEILHAK